MVRTCLVSLLIVTCLLGFSFSQTFDPVIIDWNIDQFLDSSGASADFCSFTSLSRQYLQDRVPANVYYCVQAYVNQPVIFRFTDDVPHSLIGTSRFWSDRRTGFFGQTFTDTVFSGIEQHWTNKSSPAPTASFTFENPGNFYFRDQLMGRYMYGRINVTCPDNTTTTCGSINEEDDGDSASTEGVIIYSDILSWVTLFLLWFSVAGALLTILTFTIHSDIRTYPIKLIMYLCVTIIISDFFFIMAFEPAFIANDVVCFLTGMVVHGFYLSNFCWMFCIAFNFHQMIVKRNRESESLEKWYHLGSWGFPIFCVEFVAAFRNYGDIGGACYIKSAIFIFVFFFVPGLIVISANFILFFFVAREIHETLASAPKTDKREKRKELRVYLSIFVSIGLSWIFGFLMVLFDEIVIRLIFLTLFSIFTPLQGVLIFFFYCVNAKVAGKWAGLIGKCIPFFRRWENLDTKRSTSGSRSASHNSRSSSRMNSSSNSAEASSDANSDASGSADD